MVFHVNCLLTILMKCQGLFSQKNNKNKFTMLSATILLCAYLNVLKYFSFFFLETEL